MFSVGIANAASAEAAGNDSVPSSAQLAKLEAKIFGGGDPTAAFQQLSPREKSWATLAMTPTGTPTFEVTSIQGTGINDGKTLPSLNSLASAGGCWWVQDVQTWRGGAGNWLTKGYQRTTVCGNGSSTTSVSVDNVYGDGAWGWSLQSSNTMTYNAGWEGRGVAQYHWGIWSGDTRSNCTRIKIRYDGSATSTDMTCSPYVG